MTIYWKKPLIFLNSCNIKNKNYSPVSSTFSHKPWVSYVIWASVIWIKHFLLKTVASIENPREKKTLIFLQHVFKLINMTFKDTEINLILFPRKLKTSPYFFLGAIDVPRMSYFTYVLTLSGVQSGNLPTSCWYAKLS